MSWEITLGYNTASSNAAKIETKLAKDQNRIQLMPNIRGGHYIWLSLYRNNNRMWVDNLYSAKLRCKILAIHHLNDWLIIMVEPNTFEQVVALNLSYVPNGLIATKTTLHSMDG